MRFKRLLSFALAASMLFGSAALLPEDTFSFGNEIKASAEDEMSGQCGKNVNWSLKDGVLTISGKGDMYNYSIDFPSPFSNIYKTIKSIVIKKGVTSIGNFVFYSFPVTSVKIPVTVTRIGNYAFFECKNLLDISIPSSVVSIGDQSFCNCTSLKSITIPNSVKSIGSLAFYGCENLESIIIPNSIIAIGGQAFTNTKWLENKQKENPLVVVNDILIDGKKCSGNVTVPSNVTIIADDAFLGCYYNLTSITIPNSVKIIGAYAFGSCGLTSINIPSSVTSIGEDAFKFCGALTSITIPESVTSIGNDAFYGTSWLDNQQITNPIVVVNGILIDGIECSGRISIPNNVTCIGDGAFENCDSITSITIPSSVTNIGKDAFYGCHGLTSVTIPNGVEYIGKSAFQFCSELTSITIPNSVTNIGDEAFICCQNLKSVTIPKEVANIGYGAFGYHGYDDVPDIDYYGSVNDGLKIDGFKIFCYKGTAGEKYAIYNEFDYELLDVEHIKAKDATCTEEGNIEYWTWNGKFYSDDKATNEITKEDTIVETLGHTYGNPTYTWSKDNTTCTAKRVCKNNAKHVGTETVKVTSAVKTPATCTAKGTTTYTATFENKAFAVQTKDVTNIPKLGHAYGAAVWTWDEATASAKFTCANDKSHVKTVKATVKSTTTKPTCTANGKTVYTATVEFNGKTYTDTKTVVIEKTGHDFGEWKTLSYNFKKNTSTQTRTCAVCGKTEKQTVKNAIDRLAGANRYETASVISTKMYPKTSGTVIIATGLTFHDAMVAVPLASAHNAPLLLATEKHITAQTEAELKRLKAKNVIVISTNGAIGSGAKAELKALKLKTTYIEGKNVFETSAKVAKALQTQNKKAPDTIFFATDSAFADALSASPVAAIKGAPIIYLNNKSIDKTVADYLKSVKGKIKNAYIIGGNGVISDAMMKNVAKALGLTVNKTVQRVAGANRYETCVAVNKKFKSVLNSDGICVAKGLDFPDALAGGVYAAATRQALFLADGKKLLDCQNSYLKSKNAGKITVFGGTGAVPDSLVKLIAKASV